jgi:arabinan endo-1,5-alpha-L-arabinosidase
VPFALLCQVAFAQHTLRLAGDVRGVHDPSIAKGGGTWYVFATGKTPSGGQLPVRCSNDLQNWRLCGQVFSAMPKWIYKDSPGTRELWAPDISHYDGEYRLFYAYSLFGKNTSGIALATNKTLDARSPDYKWVDKGLVLRSTAADDFNAIDPNFIADAQGRGWLAFGSFWSGIKLRRLAADGQVSKNDTKIYSIASREKPAEPRPAKPGLPADWQAVEAPFIVHHDGYYFLFVSWDFCCRGVHSTYRIMAGKAKDITGPYLDQTGVPMSEGGGAQILSGNEAWVGPGGESVLLGAPDDLIVYHAYEAKTGKPALQISTISWADGWPHVVLAADGF